MNSYAQEWVWRYSKAKGVVKFVMLAIARRILRGKHGKHETGATPVETLAIDTGLGQATVRRAIDDLAGTLDEIEVIRSSRRGEVHRYRLRRELKLPFDKETADVIAGHRSERAVTPLAVSDGPPLTLSDVAAHPEHCARGRDYVPNLLEEEVPPSCGDDVEEFVAWFTEDYRRCWQRSYFDPSPAKARAKIAQLLRVRSLDHLRLLTAVLFGVTNDGVYNSDRWFIATRPSRNIHILHQKLDFLEQELARLGWQSTPTTDLDAAWTRILDQVRPAVPAAAALFYEACRLLSDTGAKAWIGTRDSQSRDEFRPHDDALSGAVTAVLGKREIEFRFLNEKREAVG